MALEIMTSQTTAQACAALIVIHPAEATTKV
jgi:hypothetical protein